MVSKKQRTAIPSNPFDKLWHDTVVVSYEKLNHHARALGGHVRAIRRNAYRFAKGVLEMEKKHHNELVEMVRSQGVSLTAWLEDHFEIIEMMGETRERLAAAIESGVTENEYAAGGTVAIVKKRVAVRAIKIKDDGAIPPTPKTFASASEKAEHFREQFESMTCKYQGLRRELKEQAKDLAQALKRVAELERALKRAREDIEKAFRSRERTHDDEGVRSKKPTVVRDRKRRRRAMAG